MQLADAVVLVTGGTGGLGSRICHAFAAEGARVGVISLNRDRRPFKADVTEQAQTGPLIARVLAAWGG